MKTTSFIVLFFGLIWSSTMFCQSTTTTSFSASNTESIDSLVRFNWKYNTDDKLEFALPSYNDSSWKGAKILLPTSEMEEMGFKGIIWFRSKIKLDDSLLNKTLCLKLSHNGASEVFLDGYKVGGFGKVARSLKDEQRFNPDQICLPIFLRDSSNHLIAIRYSNHRAKDYIAWDEFNAGLTVGLEVWGNQFFSRLSRAALSGFFLLIMGGFLLGLTLIHLFFYLFYRKLKEHLYYSLFTFLYSTLFIIPYFNLSSFVPDVALPLTYFTPAVVPFYFISLVGFINYLIRGKLPMVFWLLIFFGIVIVFGFFYKFGHNEIFYFILITLTVHQIISVIKEGKKQNIAGIKVISRGFMVFFSMLALIGITLLLAILGFGSGSLVVNGPLGMFILVFIFCGILSIPIAISLYLAKNFATTNTSLEMKLNEVKDLSSKMIEQEKEKKKILEEQNIVLEKEVTMRTLELSEKNKDITDSIHYAKRIQYTLLAHESVLQQNLGKWFVFFKPKDIVSGDFYWATTKEFVNSKGENVKRFYLAVCDSTGHGVPGAFMSLLNISFLNEAISEKGIVEPGKVFDYVRQKLISAVSQDGAQDGMDAVLICIETITTANGYFEKSITYAAANNAPILVRKEKLMPLSVDKMPVGKGEKHNNFITHQLATETGDTLFLFTDGYADQFGGPKGKKFKYKQLHEVLLRIAPEDSSQQKIVLEKTFTDWVSGNTSSENKEAYAQIDDVCIIGIQF